MGRPDAEHLALAPGLRISAADFVESKSAILGASGSGKSGCLKVIEEELIRCQLPFIVFDPAGVAWGLKSSVRGDGPGLPILVVGGEHADLPLNRDAGAEMAREVVEANCQVIFDLSEESSGTYQKFLTDFCEELYKAQGKSKTPRLVIIDEAHEILPQDVRRADSPAFAAARKLVTRGRNRGIGVCLVSQRPAGIAKSVLTQCGTLIVFGVLGTPDRKAIGEWVSAWGAQAMLDEFDSGLASLRQQECWFWSPREFKIFQKVRIRDFRTLHPDYTNLRRMGLLKMNPVIADVEALKSRLGPIAKRIQEEKIDASQVPALRRQVAELEARAAKAQAPSVTRIDPKLRDDLNRAMASVHDLEQRNKRAIRALCVMESWAEGYVRHMSRYLERHPMPTAPDLLLPTHETQVAPTTMRTGDVTVYGYPSGRKPKGSLLNITKPSQIAGVALAELMIPRLPAPENGTADDSKLVSGERRILSALIWKSPLNRKQLSTFAGLSPKSGGYANYLGRLKKLGHILQHDDRFLITESGRAAIPEGERVGTSAFTHVEIVATWLPKLVGGERRMLQALIERYPDGMTRDELAAAAELSPTSGGFANYIGHLRGIDLIVRESDGSFRASPSLWPEQI